jgi:hypothetical protein
MGLHDTKKLLHNKSNQYQTEEAAHKMKENLPAIHLTKD